MRKPVKAGLDPKRVKPQTKLEFLLEAQSKGRKLFLSHDISVPFGFSREIISVEEVPNKKRYLKVSFADKEVLRHVGIDSFYEEHVKAEQLTQAMYASAKDYPFPGGKIPAEIVRLFVTSAEVDDDLIEGVTNLKCVTNCLGRIGGENPAPFLILGDILLKDITCEGSFINYHTHIFPLTMEHLAELTESKDRGVSLRRK
jgi:hypothetical protein